MLSFYTNLSSYLEALQGYLVDWDAQKAVWDGVFSSEVLNVGLSCDSGLMNIDLAYTGGYRRVFAAHNGTVLQPAKYPRCLRSVYLRGIRVSFLSQMHT